jgi:hypothetical protein
MKVRGVKRGNTIELLEPLDIADAREITIEIESDRLDSDFGEFIHRFREEHDLENEGIEPEEFLKQSRDRSPGREVNW